MKDLSINVTLDPSRMAADAEALAWWLKLPASERLRIQRAEAEKKSWGEIAVGLVTTAISLVVEVLIAWALLTVVAREVGWRHELSPWLAFAFVALVNSVTSKVKR